MRAGDGSLHVLVDQLAARAVHSGCCNCLRITSDVSFDATLSYSRACGCEMLGGLVKPKSEESCNVVMRKTMREEETGEYE